MLNELSWEYFETWVVKYLFKMTVEKKGKKCFVKNRGGKRANRARASCHVQSFRTNLDVQVCWKTSFFIFTSILFRHCESSGSCNGKLAQIVFTSTFNKSDVVRCCTHGDKARTQWPEAQRWCLTFGRILCHTIVKLLYVPERDAVNLMRWKCGTIINYWSRIGRYVYYLIELTAARHSGVISHFAITKPKFFKERWRF